MENDNANGEQILFRSKKYDSWDEKDVANYVLKHLPPQTPKVVEFIISTFKEQKMDGRKLSNQNEWETIIEDIMPHLENLPAVEFARTEFHPIIHVLFSIPEKMKDINIWNTLLSFCNRSEMYDHIYKEEEGYWCHDRNGRPYFNPGSWKRYGFYPNGNDTEEEKKNILSTWHVAYHGTKKVNLDGIIELGLVPPGTLIKGEKIKVLHGGTGFHIYVSPSISYSSHWVYTDPLKDGDDYFYCVLQVRVRPGSFKVQGNTLWDEGWGDRKVLYDPCFGPDELEWLIADPNDIRVTGLMVRREKQEPKQKIKELFMKNKELTSKVRAEGDGKWYWNCEKTGGSTLSRNGPWSPYGDSESKKIEKAFQQWQSVCYLGNLDTPIGTNAFFVDFSKMEQIRCNDNTLRRVIKRDQLKNPVK